MLTAKEKPEAPRVMLPEKLKLPICGNESEFPFDVHENELRDSAHEGSTIVFR